MIDIHLSETTVAVGDTLSGSFIWQPSNESKMPDMARLSLYCFTEGRGDRDKQIIQDCYMALDAHELSFPPSLTIPHDGPISYDGFLFRVIWELEIFIKMPGLLSTNDKEKCQFQVIPRLVQ